MLSLVVGVVKKFSDEPPRFLDEVLAKRDFGLALGYALVKRKNFK